MNRQITSFGPNVSSDAWEQNDNLHVIMYTICLSHLILNIGEIHYHKGKQNKWSKQIEFSAESNQFEKKSKVGINEMYC